MPRCIYSWSFVLMLGLAAALMVAGVSCDYSKTALPELPESVAQPNPSPVADASSAANTATPETAGETSVEKAAILDNVVRLIQTASANPGGKNFGNAIKNLNQYFEGTPREDYALTPAARKFLVSAGIPAKRVAEFEDPTWTEPDARHVEDCTLYHGIATRVAGQGDDLTRVRRVFEWMVQQIQLVPAGSLGSPELQQAYARPFDVLLRGMATESEGTWSERGWLFISLCRQLGLDTGLVTYTPRGLKEPIVWCCAVLIDKKLYLFDQRIGLPIPDVRGDGVATLEEAMTNPLILDRLDLPGQSPYGTTRVALLGSSSKVGILIDSGPRYFSPRMKLLQRSLAGKNVTILFRDPAEQRDRFAEALGSRLGKVDLWMLPGTVEALLFSSPQFVESTQRSLFMFQSKFPLLLARMKQLRGEIAEAVPEYVDMRLKPNATETDGITPLSRDVQQALDIYATYFLGMCRLDRNEVSDAEGFFEMTLTLLPEPGRGQPYFNMYRWGAQANLARLNEAKGDNAKAIAYYTQDDPTMQRHGHLLRARDLVWLDPTAPLPDPLSPAPTSFAPAPDTKAAGK